MWFCACLAGWAQHPDAAVGKPPYWAYAVNPADDGDDSAPADAKPQHVPGSNATYTLAQIADLNLATDWHPEEHPRMPEIVARGRAPEVYACGYCHLPNGLGRPENAGVAGLPAAYIEQQLADFKSGARKSSEPKHGPTNAMIGVAKNATTGEVRSAAEYFSSLKPRPWIRVVETDTVPKTHVAGWMLVADAPGAMESIGERIIETPVNLGRTELRDDRSGFIAYVPMGSVRRGKTLAAGGRGKAACATCHGPELKGLGKAPALAGRSPSYIVRQLYDFQSGSRAGQGSLAMRPAVVGMRVGDMVAIAAYMAGLNP
jgi:cytochrome c553